MGASASGSLNTVGFTQSVNQGHLPCYTHITHSGTYNQHFFQVGQKSKELLQLYHGVGISNCNLYGLPKRNFFLSLFLKSNKDGLPRTRNINLCIALDISGSMNSPINYQKSTQKTRLMLARDAIFMMFEKMNQNDIFSLVVFHTTSRTVIQSNFVSKLNKQEVRQAIYQNFQSGGTTIRNGFNQAITQINKFRSDVKNYQNRIVMLTDVCDNSVANQHLLIQDISNNNMIGTTIIGVSSDFKSETCQKLKEVKNFNYLCAVQNEDLKTYLYDRFDYTFFPCVQNIVIKLRSEGVDSIKVYGSADQDRTYPKDKQQFIVTKLPTVFPSQLIQNKVKVNQVQSLGGLILVKFTPHNLQSIPEIDMSISLQYQDLQGNKFNKQYVIKQKISAEEFYSNSAAKKGAQLFYYAESMRNLLKIMKDNFNFEHKNSYIQNLKNLNEYCPQSKKEQLTKVIEIVQKKQEQVKPVNQVAQAH